MTDPTTGQPAVTRILDQQEAMQDKLVALQTGQVRIETKIDTLCEQRREQHTEHVGCLAQREAAFIDNEADHVAIWKAISRLTTWGKAIAIVGTILATTLGIISVAIALGDRL